MELTPGLLDSSCEDHELRLNFTGVVAVDAIEQATGRLPARSSSIALINTSMLTGWIYAVRPGSRPELGRIRCS